MVEQRPDECVQIPIKTSSKNNIKNEYLESVEPNPLSLFLSLSL